MKRALIFAMIAMGTPACSLLLDPSSQQGHVRDAGESADTGATIDVGPHDSGPIPDTGPADTGHDAWAPSECATASQCGAGGAAGIVQCMGGRCVFCAAASEATPHELRHGPGLRPYVAIGTRTRPSLAPLLLVGSMGTSSAQPALAHRTPIDAPSTATDEPLAGAITMSCTGMSYASVSSMAFLPDTSSSSPTTAIAVVARQPSGAGMLTHLTWPDTTGTITPGGYTCRTSSGGGTDFADTTTLISAPSTTGEPGVYQVVRETGGVGSGSIAYRTFAYPSATFTSFYNGFQSTDAALVRMTSAGPFMLVPGVSLDLVVWWDPESGGDLSYLHTADRSGDPTGVLMGTATTGGEMLSMVMAYPAGANVRFVNVACNSNCSAGTSSDLVTGATAVTAARFDMVGAVPVVLTSEHLASGSEQVVLRVLRADYTGYDAPGGGGALVLDTAATGSTITDIELAVVPGTTTRYAAVWVVTEASGASSVRVQTFDATCS